MLNKPKNWFQNVWAYFVHNCIFSLMESQRTQTEPIHMEMKVYFYILYNSYITN